MDIFSIYGVKKILAHKGIRVGFFCVMIADQGQEKQLFGVEFVDEEDY